MSLINDALKKVSEAERGKPTAVQADFETRAMQAVTYEKRPSHLLWLSVVLFIGAAGIAGYVFAKTRSATGQTVVESLSKVVSETQPPLAKSSTAVGAAKISVAEKPKIEAPQVNVPTALATSDTQEVSPVPTQPVPVAVLAGPKFRLKGILYTKNPTALINGASVQAGGEVDGATVTKIESTSVTLEYQGKTTVLKLGARQ